MPGLFGYLVRDRQSVKNDQLSAMAKTMRHQPGLKTEMSVFPGFGAGRVHLGTLQPAPQPCVDKSHRFSLWLDGEFNNSAYLRRTYKRDDLAHVGDGILALELFLKMGWAFLKEIDGLFAISLYDHVSHQLTLINDRFGLRPIYWANTSQGFAYAGEAKALLHIPGISRRIDAMAVKEWFSFGFLLENRTWISGIELLPPATIMTIAPSSIKKDHYWSWQQIGTAIINKDETEIVEELGRLWRKSVEHRTDDKRLGQFLSGGLDSRAILAALPVTAHPYHTITFGLRNCDDARIARIVAKQKGVTNHLVEINGQNWFQTLPDAVWRTDGMGRILDLHGSSASNILKQNCDVHLHGFLGDATVGGSYIENSNVKEYLKSRIIKKAQSRLQTPDSLDYIMHIYKRLGLSPEKFLLNQRGQRFINSGLIAHSAFAEVRLPFFDFQFLSFSFSIPDKLRANSFIYNKMLLRFFPEFYRTISWQKTGLTIHTPLWKQKMGPILKLPSKVKRFASRTFRSSDLMASKQFTDYSGWLRIPPGRDILTRFLLKGNPFYCEHLDRAVAQQIICDFLEKGDNQHLTAIGLLLTFEIYLCRLFERDTIRLSANESN